MSYPEVSNIDRESEMAIDRTKNLSYAKLFLLGAFAIALSSFGPMSLFAAIPLSMATLFYGRGKALAMVGALGLALLFLTAQVGLTPYLVVVFIISYLYSVLLSEVFLRGIHPVHGLLVSGAIIMAIFFTLVVGIIVSGVDIQQELTLNVTKSLEVFKQNNAQFLAEKGEEARMLEDVLNDPAKIVKQIIHWSPSIVFVGNYFILWASLFILLRNSFFWKVKYAYPYSAKDMVNFKVSESLVWPFILSLGLAVGGEYLFGEYVEILGRNLLYCFGVFYFFQGFGIYLDFLSFAKIQGFFRSILVIFTVTMAWRLIAIVGIFDFWINFRRFLKKNENNSEN